MNKKTGTSIVDTLFVRGRHLALVSTQKLLRVRTWSIIVRRRGLEKGELLEGGLRSPLPGRGGEKVEGLKGGFEGGFEKGGLLKGATRGLLKRALRGASEGTSRET